MISPEYFARSCHDHIGMPNQIVGHWLIFFRSLNGSVVSSKTRYSPKYLRRSLSKSIWSMVETFQGKPLQNIDVVFVVFSLKPSRNGIGLRIQISQFKICRKDWLFHLFEDNFCWTCDIFDLYYLSLDIYRIPSEGQPQQIQQNIRIWIINFWKYLDPKHEG